MSFQQVKSEKRKPILPRARICGGTGSMPSFTTNSLSYTPKIGKRPKLAIPCSHIRTAKQPLEGKTTTKLSYVTPGHVQQFPNYRPALKYCKYVGFFANLNMKTEVRCSREKKMKNKINKIYRPEEKIEGETVNKLSYQQWAIGPKEKMPWAEKPRYCRPNEKIASDTIYHRSFPPPGYFVEECEPTEKECTCSEDKNECLDEQ